MRSSSKSFRNWFCITNGFRFYFSNKWNKLHVLNLKPQFLSVKYFVQESGISKLDILLICFKKFKQKHIFIRKTQHCIFILENCLVFKKPITVKSNSLFYLCVCNFKRYLFSCFSTVCKRKGKRTANWRRYFP